MYSLKNFLTRSVVILTNIIFLFFFIMWWNVSHSCVLPNHKNNYFFSKWIICDVQNHTRWVILHCVYVPHLSYPFICSWISRLLPCPDYYKKEYIWISSNEVDETGACNTEWSKLERKTPIQYTNTYIWNLERWSQ